RRQDRAAQFQETGAFYVLRAAGFAASGHRFFGQVGLVEIDPARAIEIDTIREFELAELIAPLFDRAEIPALYGVDALVTDFDGVHTDDRVHVAEDGSESITANRSDGAGVARLRAAGIPMLILSAEENPVVAARGAKLQVEVLQGVSDKAAVLTDWAALTGIDLDRIAYLGNDLGDLPAMRIVGWPLAVADARPEVLAAARIVLTRRGGDGAVREAAELVLAANAPILTNPTAQALAKARAKSPA
ncbi:MAG TPA: HAD hydrolase family protein, partial [Galbitalea sp.]